MLDPILFFDIDGVLNRHALHPASKACGIEPEQMRLFNWIIMETECRLVVVSAWRYMMLGPADNQAMNIRGFWYMLRTHGLYSGVDGNKNYIIDHTGPDSRDETGVDDPSERGHQVRKWLGGVDRDYCCLDDLDLGYSALNHPFVQTNGLVGLTELHARTVISHLKGVPR